MKIPLDSKSNAAYVCSLSTLVRYGADDLTKENLKHLVEGFVAYVENDAILAESLKEKPPPGGKIMRQMDILSNIDNHILFKTFISWNWDLGMWHVFVEGPEESCFEGNGDSRTYC